MPHPPKQRNVPAGPQWLVQEKIASQDLGSRFGPVSSANESGQPNLAIAVIRITFAVVPVQGGTNSLHLINVFDHPGLGQPFNELIPFFIDIRSDLVRYLAGVAAQDDSAVEGCRSEPDRGSIGTACEYQPQADMLPTVCAYPVRFLKSKVFAPTLEEERADRRPPCMDDRA